ncbi:MAG: TIGR01459 family HAD-type hydrolase [Pseudomonadota bacterium]
MTQRIDSLVQVTDAYEVIVLDQWGVLHDGHTLYPQTKTCLQRLRDAGCRLAVLSNSGKRAADNADRITEMGIPHDTFEVVMTSGEALWRDIVAKTIFEKRFYPIERTPGDAAAWGLGLDIELTRDMKGADAILLMGLPDGSHLQQWQKTLQRALAQRLKIYCSNPDLASPRPDGLVISPGALAHDYQKKGGEVIFYGKPHRPLFDSLQTALGAQRIVMVGDSLDHDIQGAQNAGWDSVLVQGGLYAQTFAADAPDQALAALLAERTCAPPTYRIEILQ